MIDDQTNRLFAGQSIQDFDDLRSWAREVAFLLTACIRLKHEGGLNIDAEDGFIPDDANEEGSMVILNQYNSAHTTVNDAHALYIQTGNFRIDGDSFFQAGDVTFTTNNITFTTNVHVYASPTITYTSPTITYSGGTYTYTGSPTIVYPAGTTVTLCGTWTGCSGAVVNLADSTFIWPNSAAPTLNVTGSAALDTSITDHKPLLAYYSGTEVLYVIAIPTLTSVDKAVLQYDAATDSFKMDPAVTATTVTATTVIVDNTGLKVDDTAGDHTLTIKPNENNTADRILNLKVNDADRTLDLAGNMTVEATSVINQDVTTDATPTFAGANLSTGTATLATVAGAIDAGGATSLEIPNAASPTVNADGEIALQTTPPTGWSHDIPLIYGGEELVYLTVPKANGFSGTPPTDGYVVSYNATNDELEFTAPAASATSVTAASTITDNALVRGDGGSRGVQSSGITIDDSDNVSGITSITVANTGLKVLDTGGDHTLTIKPGSNMTANRTLTITTDTENTLTISSSSTINQNLASNATPTFSGVILGSSGLDIGGGGNAIVSGTLRTAEFFGLDSSPSTLTIATGAVTATSSYHLIDTEAAAATDDLDTINGGTVGYFLVLQTVDNGRDVVIKHNTGNIRLFNTADITLNNTNKKILLFFDGSNWCNFGV